jgi:hypothetical protein
MQEYEPRKLRPRIIGGSFCFAGEIQYSSVSSAYSVFQDLLVPVQSFLFLCGEVIKVTSEITCAARAFL